MEEGRKAEYSEKTPDDELQRMPHTKTQKFKPQARLEPRTVTLISPTQGGRNSSLVLLGLAVHSVAGSILLWGNFPVEGIFPMELTWVQTPFPKKLLRMRV